MTKDLPDPNQGERKLYQELAASPLVEVTGIVDASGVGGGRSAGQKLWSLLLSFDAWRIGAGPVRKESLTIRCEVSDEELKKFQEAIDEETILRIRARVALENVFDSPQALLVEILQTNAEDAELQEHLTELQKPVTHHDEVLGEFAFDRVVNWYTGRVLWNSQPIELHLSAEEPDDLAAALKTAHALWRDASSWNTRIRDFAVQELLPLKNDNWLGDDEAELSPEEFQGRMTLESITVHPDESFEFWHEDGDLFWGHSILVSGDLSDGPTDADIPG